ncbi:anaphase-promoting complex subunit 4-like, partial [Acanthaster planci]|uniref:Anaphase-promoting complex subunit 4 n=1 Tax=Acanthaster planci TaxID=133434 RepID=A0A8B7Y0L5_ACAPL
MQTELSTMLNAFRQLEERSLATEVSLMCWSPRMDLVALANVNGEVLLQRLTWQKQPVWVLPPPASEENKKVNVLSWRPDGKVLAVGYMGGLLLLCSVENADVLHSMEFKSTITCMQWVDVKQQELQDTKTTDSLKGQEQDLFADGSDVFLPKLPPLAKIHSAKAFSEDNVEDAKRIKGQKSLNVLVVGLHGGILQLYAYGIAAIGEIKLCRLCQEQRPDKQFHCRKVIAATLSKDLRSLSVMLDQSHDDTNFECTVYLLSLDCILMSSRMDELTRFAFQSSKITTFLEYLSATLHSVSEAREDILMEIETKLTKYAEQKKAAGSIRDELLQLLLWGRASPELQAFLLHELTEKGMKKLGQSVENSYSNIQKLVLKHIYSVGRSLVYHLNHLKGMSLWYDKYGIIGLSPTAIEDAIGTVGSFMLKASELLQVIDSSLKNFKAFFRWLYVVMMRLSEEPVPSALNKVRQRDITFISDFLAENFSEEIGDLGETGKQSGFTLERVGQYLKRQDLQFLLVPSPNVETWQASTDSSPYLKSSPLLYKHHPTKSLLQLFDNMEEAIRDALTKPAVAVGQSVRCLEIVPLYTHSAQGNESNRKELRHAAVNQHPHSETPFIYTVLMVQEAPTEVMYLIRQPCLRDETQAPTGALCLRFSSLGTGDYSDGIVSHHSQRGNQYEILDSAFFDNHTLSVLLQERWGGPESASIICQVPLAALLHQQFTLLSEHDEPLNQRADVISLDAGGYVSHSRRLDNIKASIFAVSGSRKVSCVLFSNHRRVRLFDMDAEDDGEDESLSESLQDTSSAGMAPVEMAVDDKDSNKEN